MYKNIAIYGAQLWAGTIYSVLKELYESKVSYFIVSDKTGNPEFIDNIKVLTLNDYLSKDLNEPILVAVPEEHHNVIASKLKEHNKNELIFLTSELRNRLLEKYYSSNKDFTTLDQLRNSIIKKRYDKSLEGLLDKDNYSKNWIAKFICIYMARSSKDKAMKHTYELPAWNKQIQAGAAIDNGSLGILRDDQGENISLKNLDFCELTVLYWIWKNVKNDYIGLCHYRRVFRLQLQDLLAIKEAKPDVILPYPTIHCPGISSQYVRYLSDQEIQVMKEAIFRIAPEIEDDWDNIWNKRYFLNYNMLIARRDILDQYCTWLFDILKYVEFISFERNISMSKRYAGYLGEILCTVYFQYYKKDYKMIYAGVDILS